MPLLPQLGTALLPIMQALVPIISQLAGLMEKDLQNSLTQVLTVLLPVIPAAAKLVVSLMPLISLVLTLAGWFMDLVAKINGPVLQAVAWLITAILNLASHWQDVVNWIETAGLWLWHNVLDPMWQGIKGGADWVYQQGILPLWHGINDVFGWIGGAVDWVWHHVFDPMWDGIKTGADHFIDGFKTSWNTIQDIFKNPVNFLIGTVYDKGIVKMWNTIVDAIGQSSLDLPIVPMFASGGVVPGYAPGQDTVPAMLSPGEGVLVPEAVAALGPGTILALNAAYGGGRVSTPGHYKGGGIIDWVTSTAKGGWDDISGFFDKGMDLAKVTAAIATGNTTALSNALGKLVGTNASGNFAKMMLGVPTSLIHNMVQAIGNLFSGSSGGGSSSAAGSVTGSVAQWFADAVAATGAPASWIPDLETIGHYESGDDPRSINLWDSNAAAGDPSRGIMQTIMSTFLAYHQAGTSSDIFDPVANIASAINYIRARYGDVSNVPGIKSLARGGSYVGYDSGGWLMPGNMPVNGLARPEAVLTPDQSQWLQQMAQAGTAQRGAGVDPSRQVVINFNGTQYPNAEQMAAIRRDMALALSGAG
jgi:SLT domain-containing protein